ncbi:cyclic diguanylate phosphodiesterase (EAL) domain-containing protein [Klebsiella pneumoniae]|nr:cyclic diguanylate phosphodiesterase (EAL) domain-containing protein [Klebsiella pneumoniae]
MNTKIFEDNILSRNDIAVRYVFQKMFSPQGTLVAVEWALLNKSNFC